MSTQLGLPFDTLAAREVRMARRGDPETSRIAASQAHGVASEHRMLILRSLRDGGDRDWTAHEIAEACQLTAVQVCRRLHELLVDGEIVESFADGKPVTRRTPSDRPARCWRIAR